MASRFLIILSLLVLSVQAQNLQTNCINTFEQKMKSEIKNGNVIEAEGEGEEPLPAGIQGRTVYLDESPADFSWVRAIATDNENINAWVHTTWSIHWDYYVINTNTPQSIPTNHSYYIKGFHWVPTDRQEDPPQGSNPVQPEWATGIIESDTYKTTEYEFPSQQIFCHVMLKYVTIW